MKFKCKHCGCETEYLVFKPFKNPHRQWAGDPAWAFHVKSICFNCHKFNGFKKQTDKLILEELNETVMMKLDLKERLYNPDSTKDFNQHN